MISFLSFNSDSLRYYKKTTNLSYSKIESTVQCNLRKEIDFEVPLTQSYICWKLEEWFSIASYKEEIYHFITAELNVKTHACKKK